jgi:opacity protein-like surface antigen
LQRRLQTTNQFAKENWRGAQIVKFFYFCLRLLNRKTPKNYIMVKKIIFLTIATFVINFLHAQDIRLALQANPQLSWLKSSNSNITNKGVAMGIDYGLVADFHIGGHPRYCINTGVLVSNQAFTSRYNGNEAFSLNQKTFDQAVEIKYRMNYLQLPLNMKLKTDQFNRITFYGQFGLSNYLNLSAVAYSSDSQLNGDNVSSAIRMYYLSLLMGGGVEYDLGSNTTLNLGIQYSNGLTDATALKTPNDRGSIQATRLVVAVLF